MATCEATISITIWKKPFGPQEFFAAIDKLRQAVDEPSVFGSLIESNAYFFLPIVCGSSSLPPLAVSGHAASRNA